MGRRKPLNVMGLWTAPAAVAIVVACAFLLYRVGTHPQATTWALPGSAAALIGSLGIFIFLPAWGILDALGHSHASWWAAGHSKAAWVLVQVGIPVAGPLAYFSVIHPRVAGPQPAPRIF
jgi:hypothetical protein